MSSITRGAGLADFTNNEGVGIDVRLNAGSQNLLISGVNSDFNLRGLEVNTFGVGTELDLDVIDNFGFNGNDEQGIAVTAAGGSELDLEIAQSSGFNGGALNIARNGIRRGEAALSLFAGGSIGQTSTIIADISDVNIAQNNRQITFRGIQADARQDGLIQLNAEDVSITDNSQAITIFVEDNVNTLEPSRFAFNRLNVDNNLGSSLTLFTDNDTLTELVVENSVFNVSNSTAIGQPGPIFADRNVVGTVAGINVFASGANNLTRVIVRDNQISRFDQVGLGLSSSDSSTILADVSDNIITFNGFGPGRLGGGTGAAIQPFGDGITVIAQDNSQLAYRAESNIVSNNFEFGLGQSALDNSQILASLVGNDFTGNDIAEDPDNGVIDNNGIDVSFANGATSNTILSLSNNDFDPTTAVFTNAGAAGQLEVALDGLTNGPEFGQGNIIVPNQAGVFGTTGVAGFGLLDSTFNSAGF